ncbi:tetratricopeptide repeat protein [Sorangium sp. So ce291]|uniref:tetratricopeptide repeat protein n=1 Tax=Sorangium sp. So ce291 TaxID=3133294 RepID=UPI003F5E7ABD
MVLPASAPDDQPRPRQADWIEQIKRGLRLSRAGILLHVDDARMERLGELTRALVADHPEMDVHTDVRDAETAPEGSVMVLVPKPEDADWLNLRRPLFARRALKVVLFCDRETTIALAQRAVDFFDWVSQHHECPPGPVPHAVSGLRCAAEAEALGVLWTTAGELADTGRMWGAFSAAFPGETLRWVSAEHPHGYEKLVDDIRAAGSAWIACHADGSAELRRLRWALAEAGRRSKVIALAPPVSCPGWWALHDHLMPLADARRALEDARATRPGCLAALTNLEPEAVEIARALSAQGLAHRELVALLKDAPDPGAALALRAADAGLIERAQVARGAAPAPALRALLQAPDRAELVGSVHSAVAKREDVSAEAVGLRASMSTASPRFENNQRHFDMATPGFLIESQLRWFELRQQQSRDEWVELAANALDLGETGAAGSWALRAAPTSSGGGVRDKAFDDVLDRLAALDQAHGTSIRTRLASMDSSRIPLKSDVIVSVGSVLVICMALLFSNLNIASRLMFSAVGAVLLCSSLYRMNKTIRRHLHSRALRERSKDAATAMTQRLQAAIDLGLQGQPALAVPALKAARDAIRGELGQNHPLYRKALTQLAMNAADAGEEEEALHFLQEALSLENQTAGFGDPSFAELIALLAGVLTRQGSAAEAEALLRKLLGTEGASPQAERATALPQAALSSLSDRKSRERVLIVLARPGPRPEVAPEVKSRALRHLAEALSAQGRYDEAESTLEIALEHAAQRLPAAHPERWRSLTVLGQVLSLQRRDDAAETALQQAAHLAQAAFGERHVEVARALRELARLKARRRDPDASGLARKALAAYAESTCAADEREAAQKELIPICERGEVDSPPSAKTAAPLK